jgi:hypothetical protein
LITIKCIFVDISIDQCLRNRWNLRIVKSIDVILSLRNIGSDEWLAARSVGSGTFWQRLFPMFLDEFDILPLDFFHRFDCLQLVLDPETHSFFVVALFEALVHVEHTAPVLLVADDSAHGLVGCSVGLRQLPLESVQRAAPVVVLLLLLEHNVRTHRIGLRDAYQHHCPAQPI